MHRARRRAADRARDAAERRARIDAGIGVAGGFEAGRALARLCMGGLGHVQYAALQIDGETWPGVQMRRQDALQNHIHTIVRTANGNDSGRDLLRQHYAQHSPAAGIQPSRAATH